MKRFIIEACSDSKSPSRGSQCGKGPERGCRMKYGVNLMVWTTHIGPQHEALFSRIKKWGFDGVEFFLSPDEPDDLPSVKRSLDRLGLERTMCSVLPREANLVSPDASVRAHGVKFLTRCVERTAEFGS